MENKRLSQVQFKRFSEFIYANSGIRINDNKVLLLSNRIRRRVQACDLGTFDDYYRFLKSSANADEIAYFLDVVTTNETFFFRTQKHFQWFRNDFINGLVSHPDAKTGPRSLRIWSSACSTGAEPYSIAICLAENRYRLKDFSVNILATDISQEMLGIASEGKFKARTMESVTAHQRRRFFQHVPDEELWQVRPEIRNMVKFKRHNLLNSPPVTKFDCIFICNVLIYFDQGSKKLAVENALKALGVGGYLVVGPSEGISDKLGSLRKISPLVYQKVRPNPGSTPSLERGARP